MRHNLREFSRRKRDVKLRVRLAAYHAFCELNFLHRGRPIDQRLIKRWFNSDSRGKGAVRRFFVFLFYFIIIFIFTFFFFLFENWWRFLSRSTTWMAVTIRIEHDPFFTRTRHMDSFGRGVLHTQQLYTVIDETRASLFRFLFALFLFLVSFSSSSRISVQRSKYLRFTYSSCTIIDENARHTFSRSLQFYF